MNFYAIGINLFLIVKNLLTIMVPILINKDVSEPSYNDLKFIVQNCNNFCTNLTDTKCHISYDFIYTKYPE